MDYNFSLFIILILLLTSWYYFTKFRDLETNHYMLMHHINKMNVENANYKARIKDLQKYKNDVSKTFKILDNELVHINNHVEKNNQMLSQNNTETNILDSSLSQSRSLNLLTPDMLNNLIENMNQEFNIFSPVSVIPLNTTLDTSLILNTNTCENLISGNITSGSVTVPEITTQGNNVLTSSGNVITPLHIFRNTTIGNIIGNNTTLLNNVSSQIGTSLLRSMSFPNLPNSYQRLIIPSTETIITRIPHSVSMNTSSPQTHNELTTDIDN